MIQQKQRIDKLKTKIDSVDVDQIDAAAAYTLKTLPAIVDKINEVDFVALSATVDKVDSDLPQAFAVVNKFKERINSLKGNSVICNLLDIC